MKTLMMKSGLLGIVLGVGMGFTATNPCVPNVNSYQLRTLGRAEAHQRFATGSEALKESASPTPQRNVYSLRAMGRAEAHRILPMNAGESPALADVGRIDRLRALGRGEARYIGKMDCGDSANLAPEVGKR